DRPFKGYVTRYKDFWLRRYRYRRLVVENFISQPAVFFRRRLLDRVGLLDPDYHLAMDYHLWLRMGRIAAPAFLDRELAYFRSSGDNKMSLQWRKSFQEDLDAARRVAGDSNRWSVALHRLNGFKLSAAYWLLDRLR
ncbi:MAG: glycosyltransferase family 2 protein, partial [Polyangia bacterium]